jgi:two-component system nitrate/nitrite response regulator NarL
VKLLRTVVVCDTEPIALEGLRRLLDSAEGLRVVAAGNSLLEAMDAVRELRPDIAILDKALGSHALVDWIAALRSSGTPPGVVVWGAAISDAEALRYLNAGATGILRKTSALGSILTCLRTVGGGGTWLEPDMLRKPARDRRNSRSPLTIREAEVLELVQQGLRNKEIAFALGIRIGTVKIHMKHIFEKTGIHGRFGLAVSSFKDQPVATEIVA